MLIVFSIPSWGLVSTQQYESYRYDGSYISDSTQNYNYGTAQKLLSEKAQKTLESLSEKPLDRSFFALLNDFIVTKGTPKSLKDQAADLIPQNANKNRVTLRSPSQKMEVDLAGRTHGDIPTPHTKVSPRNSKAPNQPAYNGGSKL